MGRGALSSPDRCETETRQAATGKSSSDHRSQLPTSGRSAAETGRGALSSPESRLVSHPRNFPVWSLELVLGSFVPSLAARRLTEVEPRCDGGRLRAEVAMRRCTGLHTFRRPREPRGRLPGRLRGDDQLNGAAHGAATPGILSSAGPLVGGAQARRGAAGPRADCGSKPVSSSFCRSPRRWAASTVPATATTMSTHLPLPDMGLTSTTAAGTTTTPGICTPRRGHERELPRSRRGAWRSAPVS